MTETNSPLNPYVGPVTFTYADRARYFGREREAHALLSLVIAERLTLFYAQSGAGKSSLLNTRLIPGLREQARYLVLPVGRVGGAMPQGVSEVDNIYAFNLMLSLDRNKTDADPSRFAGLTLPQFLDGLRTTDGLQYEYDVATAERATQRRSTEAAPNRRNQPPYVLIIDQFEEVITTHADRWRDRAAFFQQLAAAMRDDPLLWVVLTLREDFVAPLDPFADLLPGRLSTRFYMERMGIDAALSAITQPAADAGRPFEPEAAEQLVDNLRQVRVAGQEGTFPGQYVEPVQLQVACYQLWENLRDDGMARGQDDKMSVDTPSSGHQVIPSSPPPLISLSDLERAGDVDTALADFYEQALAAALALPDLTVSERQLRLWVDEQLITEAETRSTVYRGTTETAGVNNAVIDVLQNRFLLHTELRSGGAWVELLHDRFIDPIRRANLAWREEQITGFDQSVTNDPHMQAIRRKVMDAWAEYIEQGIENNTVMFSQVLNAFMRPYYMTIVMYTILFFVGVGLFVIAAWLSIRETGDRNFALLFGGLGVATFLAFFVSRPLAALEENLLLITRLGVIYNTYWTRLHYIQDIDTDTVQAELEEATRDAIAEFDNLLDSNAAIMQNRPGLRVR